MQSYKTLQSKATKINSYISIINSLRVVQVGLDQVEILPNYFRHPERKEQSKPMSSICYPKCENVANYSLKEAQVLINRWHCH